MKVALVSLNQTWEDKKSNQTKIEAFLENQALLDVEYVVFPELTLTGFSMNTVELGEEIETSETIANFQKLAIKFKKNFVFGLITQEKDKYYNSCIAINSDGELKGRYNKIHPFSFSGEDNYFSSGNEIVSVDWQGGWGLTICYDLRFPELYQALSKENHILISIANWPKRRVAHWRNLLIARAIENQAFMIGVNRTGTDGNNLEYEKSSVIITPEGEQLRPEETFEEVEIFTIELEKAYQYRKDFPVKRDRRADFYKTIL